MNFGNQPYLRQELKFDHIHHHCSDFRHIIYQFNVLSNGQRTIMTSFRFLSIFIHSSQLSLNSLWHYLYLLPKKHYIVPLLLSFLWHLILKNKLHMYFLMYYSVDVYMSIISNIIDRKLILPNVFLQFKNFLQICLCLFT